MTSGKTSKKLLIEIDKLKNKLGANNKIRVFLEGLVDDNDFNDSIEREKLNIGLNSIE